MRYCSTGADVYFPGQMPNLFRDISGCGALISEFPIRVRGNNGISEEEQDSGSPVFQAVVVRSMPLKRSCHNCRNCSRAAGKCGRFPEG